MKRLNWPQCTNSYPIRDVSNFVDSIQNNNLSIFLVRSDPGDESEERVRRDSGSWKSALTSRAFASRPRRRPSGRPPPKDERHRREETGSDLFAASSFSSRI